jgi:hypothetical protein
MTPDISKILGRYKERSLRMAGMQAQIIATDFSAKDQREHS